MDIRTIQSALASLGIYKGKVDGIKGPLTDAAIRAFQRLNSLAPDGIVGPKTQAELFPPALAQRLDPPLASAPALRPIWPHQSECVSFYGGVGQHQTLLTLPFPMRIAWDKDKYIQKFSVHELVHDSALRCFERIAHEYDDAKRADCGIDLFGGCLNVRPMRGGSAYSMHSWGIAIDFDPERNQLKWTRERARLARPDCELFWRIWEDEGWCSLGRSKNFDWMHVQAARV